MKYAICLPDCCAAWPVHPCCFSASQVSDSARYSRPRGGSPGGDDDDASDNNERDDGGVSNGDNYDNGNDLTRITLYDKAGILVLVLMTMTMGMTMSMTIRMNTIKIMMKTKSIRTMLMITLEDKAAILF